jgi:hypothetical protein
MKNPGKFTPPRKEEGSDAEELEQAIRMRDASLKKSGIKLKGMDDDFLRRQGEHAIRVAQISGEMEPGEISDEEAVIRMQESRAELLPEFTPSQETRKTSPNLPPTLKTEGTSRNPDGNKGRKETTKQAPEIRLAASPTQSSLPPTLPGREELGEESPAFANPYASEPVRDIPGVANPYRTTEVPPTPPSIPEKKPSEYRTNRRPLPSPTTPSIPTEPPPPPPADDPIETPEKTKKTMTLEESQMLDQMLDTPGFAKYCRERGAPEIDMDDIEKVSERFETFMRVKKSMEQAEEYVSQFAKDLNVPNVKTFIINVRDAMIRISIEKPERFYNIFYLLQERLYLRSRAQELRREIDAGLGKGEEIFQVEEDRVRNTLADLKRVTGYGIFRRIFSKKARADIKSEMEKYSVDNRAYLKKIYREKKKELKKITKTGKKVVDLKLERDEVQKRSTESFREILGEEIIPREILKEMVLAGIQSSAALPTAGEKLGVKEITERLIALGKVEDTIDRYSELGMGDLLSGDFAEEKWKEVDEALIIRTQELAETAVVEALKTRSETLSEFEEKILSKLPPLEQMGSEMKKGVAEILEKKLASFKLNDERKIFLKRLIAKLQEN